MADKSEFLIEEIAEGAALKADNGAGAKFSWSAAKHSMPFKPWSFGGQQRTVRVDYPGGDSPTEQVLGPNYTPFTLNGVWVDKFNPLETLLAKKNSRGDQVLTNASSVVGYAKETMQAFEAMCRRGNLIRLSFQDIKIEGLITNWEFSYEHEGKIGYSFTVSPHQRPGGDQITNRPLRQVVKDPFTSAKDIQNSVDAMQDMQDVTDAQRILKGQTFEESKTLLQELTDGAQEMSDLINQRSIGEDSISPALALRKAIAVSSAIIGTCSDIITGLAALKSDTAVAFQDAIAVLRFETWTRGLSAQARVTIFNTHETRESFTKQTDPNAIALYRPFKNESLYSISQKFYGTPYNWRLIKERNKLTSSNLTGQELLVIPEATA
jgi:hypothetical protein